MPILVSFSVPNLPMSFSAIQTASERIRQMQPQDGDAVLGSKIRKKYEIKDGWYQTIDVCPEPRCYDAVLGTETKLSYQRGKDGWYSRQERSFFDFLGYEPVEATIIAEERDFPSLEYGINGASASCLVVRSRRPDYFLIVTLNKVDFKDLIAFECELEKRIKSLSHRKSLPSLDVRVKDRTFCDARLVKVEPDEWMSCFGETTFVNQLELTFQYDSIHF